MKILIKEGDDLRVELEDSDGSFTISYRDGALTVNAELPDSEGREGVIYHEDYRGDGDEEDDEEDQKCARCNRWGCVCVRVNVNEDDGEEPFRCPNNDCDADRLEDCCTQTPEERKVGFWTAHEPGPNNRDLDLPWPWPNARPFVGQKAFLEKLEDIESDSHASMKRYRGFSTCRCCKEPNGSAEISYTFTKPEGGRVKYTWPIGYSHYIETHNVRPEQEFVELVMAYDS